MSMEEVFEIIREEVNMDVALAEQNIEIDGGRYYFDILDESDWDNYGDVSSSYAVYRVIRFDIDREEEEETDLIIKQECEREGNFMSFFEYSFGVPYLVKRKERTYTTIDWEPVGGIYND